MIFLGIDPGKEGGMAWLNQVGHVLKTAPVPVTRDAKGKTQYDLPGILDVIRWTPAVGVFVTVEKSQPLPPKMGGTQANFGRGVSRGWEWALVALGIPYQLVSPPTWQRVMFAGTDAGDPKKRALIACQRLWPALDVRATDRSKKPHDGIVDALLIAEYGRRSVEAIMGPE